MQQPPFLSWVSVAPMGLDKVTALMEPRVTCRLATFFWMAGGHESQQVNQRAHQGGEVATDTYLRGPH